RRKISHVALHDIDRRAAFGPKRTCTGVWPHPPRSDDLMGASLYEPINVYKPVAPNIGIVDGPFEYLTVGGVKLPLPFTTRITVVRLSNGDLFLHSPIKFDERLAKELLGLGAVRHLVSPNQFHYAHIGEWVRGFPMQFRGHRRVCAKEPVPGMLTST